MTFMTNHKIPSKIEIVFEKLAEMRIFSAFPVIYGNDPCNFDKMKHIKRR